MKLRVPVAIALFAVLVLGTGLARGATGDVSYVGCISGEIASSSCTQTPSATADGEDSGFDGAESATITADGRSAYVSAEGDAAIVSFARNRTTGGLTFASCIGGEADVSTCGEIPTATIDGVDSGLEVPDTVIASADGKSVYAAAVGDDAVATFNRDPATGALSYVGCRSGVSGLAACTPITGATATGDDSGLNTPTAFSLSSDGKSLYVAASGDSSIARFNRDPASGALTYAGCLSGESDVAGCTAISGATATGLNSGLASANGVATSPDGTSVYAAGNDDDALARFTRDPGSGALTYVGCQSTDSAATPCAQLSGAVAGGLDTGLDQINSVVVAPEGNSIHTTAFADASIATFTRDPATGAATYTGCISGETASAPCTQVPSATATGADSGLDSPIGIGAAPDGLSIHAAGNGDAALVSLARNPATGALTYAGCISGETQSAGCTQIASAALDGTNSGLDAPRAATLSADGRAVYVPSATDDGIATFAREGLACKGSPVTSVGSAVAESLSGTEEADVIAAGDGDDSVDGLGGGDLLCGEAGNDAVSGGAGNDSAEGGDGDDTIKGDAGKDKLKGNDGKDKLKGGAGKDKLKGDAGKDKLKGDAGKDKLNGGAGKDTCNGGAGKDKAGNSCEKVKKVP